MGLRRTILLRITVGWLVGLVIATAPLALPWREDTLIPSSSMVMIAVELALPLLLAGGLCCAIWPDSVAAFPLRWSAATLVASWLYLALLKFGASIPSPWIGALVATSIFFLWARYRPLLPSRQDTPSAA